MKIPNCSNANFFGEILKFVDNFYTMFILQILLFIIIFLFLILPMIIFGAPFLPSIRNKKLFQKDLQCIFNLIKNKEGKFIDLGSGDGRVVIEFAKRRFESYGIEINPFLVFLSRWKIKKSGIANTKIIWGTFWNINLKDFNVIYFFQANHVNKKLQDKILKETVNGTIIISYGFGLDSLSFLSKIGSFYIYINK